MKALILFTALILSAPAFAADCILTSTVSSDIAARVDQNGTVFIPVDSQNVVGKLDSNGVVTSPAGICKLATIDSNHVVHSVIDSLGVLGSSDSQGRVSVDRGGVVAQGVGCTPDQAAAAALILDLLNPQT